MKKISQKLAPTATHRVEVGAYWIKIFCATLRPLKKIPDTPSLDKINYEMLKKSWDRSDEKKILKEMLSTSRPLKKISQTLAPTSTHRVAVGAYWMKRKY